MKKCLCSTCLFQEKVNGVDSKFLNPRNSWPDAADWDKAARELGEKFINNFRKFTDIEHGRQLVSAGPQL
jgi:phosphoenolpyruvate carboxykinase (ATP)